jgi:hypothetical protein
MTITATPPTAPRSWKRPALGALLTSATAAGLTFLALRNPPGAIPLGNDNYDTQFVNDAWVTASLLLAVPIFLISWVSGRLGVLAALTAGFCQFVIAEVTVQRYVDSGWSDGLEGLAYLYAFFVAAGFLVVALVAWFFGRRRRARTS